MSWWGPQPFQWNSCKNFKKRVRKSVSKRQVESVKESVIGYIIPRTSSEWHVIESAWQNTDIARKANSRMAMNCQSYCYGILHFVLGSHLILQWNMSFFVSLLLWNHEMFLSNGILTKYFDKTPTCKIKDNQSWRLKVFWLQKWLNAWKWHEVTKQFWTHTSWNWTTSCS